MIIEEIKNMNCSIEIIDYKTAIEFLLPRHYSNRKPSIKWAFGFFVDGNLSAVMTVGKPASNSLCFGICGKEYSKHVYELNRLCRVDNLEIPLSFFVSRCLKMLKKENIILVSYADTAMNHTGFIYQACNFKYTGKTKERTDKYTEGNKHSRHYDKDKKELYRKVRSSKYRYVYFCTNNKKVFKNWNNNLNYTILPYPKEKNYYYKLGDFLAPKILLVD